MRRDKITFPREVIEELYFAKRLPLRTVGKQLGVCASTVLENLRDYGLRTRNRTETISQTMKGRPNTALKGRPNPKVSQALKGRRTFHSPETCRKLSLAQKRLWATPEFVKEQFKRRSVKPNGAERKLGALLQELYPNEWQYVGDGQVVIGTYSPDFINRNGQKKLIELFGEYWHEAGEENERITTFKHYGFDTLVIWSRELTNPETLTRKIKEFAAKEAKEDV